MNENILDKKKSTQKTILDQPEDIRDFFENIIANMPGNVYWKDINGFNLGCNNNLAKALGYSKPAELKGKTDYDFYPKDKADILRKNDDKILATGLPKIIEEKGENKDGKTQTYLTNKIPLKDKNNRIIGLLGVSIDITDQKEMEKKLEQARKLQEKAQNAKIQGMMEIAAGIAHEIRTPLTSIQCATDAKIYMDRLIEGYNMAEEAGLPVTSIRPSHMEGLKNIFNSIDAEAKESMQIIDMFLGNLKSMVKEANTSDYQLCSIKESISIALSRYPFDEQQKNSVVYTDADDFKFYGINLLVQHIIFNLMKNALYYLGEKPDAIINIWHEQGEIDNFLHFKDTGPGISEYDQARIFDFGFSKRKDGSGFGLTYCRTTMQQMGGDIAVRSKLGKYTEFILTFPKIKK